MGAKRIDIIYQFLAETIVLTGTGGLLGIAFGFLCKPGVSLVRLGLTWFPDIWKSLPPTIRNLEPHIAPWSIVAAAGISVLVGVIFGLYPAQRAAAMDPIEALRHE
jgi:ABC-type antimicrobial peptide transport system permease subunit